MDSLEQLEPSVEVELGGKKLALTYTMRSVAQYKRLTGRSLLGGDIDPTDPEAIIALIWCGLVNSQPDMDGAINKGEPDANIRKQLNWIERSMKLSDVGPLSEAIKEAFEQAAPKSKREGAEKNAKGTAQK